MELTLKQKKLLVHLLNEKEYKPSEFFAAKLGVSVRTVYNDLHMIEAHIAQLGIKLHRKPGVGLKFILEGQERLNLLNSINLNTRYVDKLSVEKRVQNIALSLLYAGKAISMQELSDIHFISKSSIAKDIERIEKTIVAFRLRIVKSPKGMRISGEEKDIRRAIHDYIKSMTREELQEKGAKPKAGARLDAITHGQMLRFFDAELIRDVEHCFMRLETAEGRFLSDAHYFNVLSHTLILLKRAQLGKENAFRYGRLNELKQLKAYVAAKSVLSELADKYSLIIPENEIAYLATYILSCNLNRTEYAFSYGEDFEGKIDACIDQMCAIASNIISIDLTADEVLKNGLKLHITPMLNRCKFQIKIDNPILSEIQSQYSSAYSIIRLLTVIIEDAFETQISPEEVGYLTMYFAAAAERYLLRTPRKILIVCHQGLGTSQLLANRIKQLIANIEIVAVIGSGRLGEVDPASIEFIISTVHLGTAPKPVIVISPLLNEQDIAKLNSYIWGIQADKKTEAQLKPGIGGEIMTVIEEKLIFCGIQKESKEDVLRFLCAKLEEAGCVDGLYFSSVAAREELSPTFVGNLVALPHGDEAHVKKEKIVLCLLKEAIEWGGGKVKLIIFIAIRTHNKERFKTILKVLYHLFDDREAMRRIMQAKQPREIYEYIKTIN